MLFDHKLINSDIDDFDFNVTMGGNQLTKTTTYKYLGIQFDNKLSWDVHINHLCKKLSQVAGIIFKNRNCLSLTSLLLVYNSLVGSRLRYGLCTWGTACNARLQKLNQIHDKIIRFMSFAKPCSNVDPLYKTLGILKLEELLKVEQAKFMYKFNSNSLPAVFSTYVSKPKHGYSTSYVRNGNFSMIHASSSKLQTSIKYVGPKIWCTVPAVLKNALNAKAFARGLKKYYIENSLPD